MKKTLFFLFVSILFIGTGCMNGSHPTPGDPTETHFESEQPVAAVESHLENTCPSGTLSYLDDTNGLTFCHPETTEVQKENNHYYINDLEGNVLRELAILPLGDESSLLNYIEHNYINQNSLQLGFTCETMTIPVPNGMLYLVYGYPTGNPDGQGYESVDTCRDTEEYRSALTTLIPELFFEPTQNNGLFVVINGEQDPTLGEFTEEFIQSISFSE